MCYSLVVLSSFQLPSCRGKAGIILLSSKWDESSPNFLKIFTALIAMFHGNKNAKNTSKEDEISGETPRTNILAVRAKFTFSSQVHSVIQYHYVLTDGGEERKVTL